MILPYRKRRQWHTEWAIEDEGRMEGDVAALAKDARDFHEPPEAGTNQGRALP